MFMSIYCLSAREKFGNKSFIFPLLLPFSHIQRNHKKNSLLECTNSQLFAVKIYAIEGADLFLREDMAFNRPVLICLISLLAFWQLWYARAIPVFTGPAIFCLSLFSRFSLVEFKFIAIFNECIDTGDTCADIMVKFLLLYSDLYLRFYMDAKFVFKQLLQMKDFN